MCSVDDVLAALDTVVESLAGVDLDALAAPHRFAVLDRLEFDGPTHAIRCAEALRDDAETLGIEIRAGIHTGECELFENDVGGIAVHIAARILGHAGRSDILVSRTVRDLVVGSGTGFDDRGNVELRGVPGTWQLLAIDRRGARVGSAEAELTATATPGPQQSMRTSDRAVAMMARRTPWILRGVARLSESRRRT
jgi:class 3 adenylate cyclase